MKNLCPYFIQDFKGFNAVDSLASANTKSLHLAHQPRIPPVEKQQHQQVAGVPLGGVR